MAPRKVSLAVIRRTVSALPDVEEGSSYGTPCSRPETHYIGYPMELAHLDRLSTVDLKKLLLRSMATMGSKKRAMWE